MSGVFETTVFNGRLPVCVTYLTHDEDALTGWFGAVEIVSIFRADNKPLSLRSLALIKRSARIMDQLQREAEERVNYEC